MEKDWGVGMTIATTARRLFRQTKNNTRQRVRFASKVDTVGKAGSTMTVEATYDSEPDGNYISKENRVVKLRLPILRKICRRLGVTNGKASTGKRVTRLRFDKLSDEAAEADTFDEFKTSRMSVGKTADDGYVAVFTKRDVKVYKEYNVLITYKEAIKGGVTGYH